MLKLFTTWRWPEAATRSCTLISIVAMSVFPLPVVPQYDASTLCCGVWSTHNYKTATRPICDMGPKLVRALNPNRLSFRAPVCGERNLRFLTPVDGSFLDFASSWSE